MGDPASWIAAAIGAVALVVSYLTYASQRARTRLEYVVLTSTRLLPGHLAGELEVSYGGEVLAEPALSVVRLVSTGDESIKSSDFETPLVIAFEGVRQIASATWVNSKPKDLRPALELGTDCVEVSPALINPGDGLQLQVLTAGQPTAVVVSGRIAELEIVERASLPYPPGSGGEGEMLAFDRFMWFFFTPAGVLGFAAWVAFSDGQTATSRAIVLVVAILIAGVLYPLRVRYLVIRRRRWRL